MLMHINELGGMTIPRQTGCFLLHLSKQLTQLLILQVRVEQVLVSEPGAVQLYKLANLVKFYETTIR